MSQNSTFDFSKTINELEEINRWFQNEDVDLDAGLTKFRRGLELIKKCRERLSQVENEFIEIKKEFGTEEKAQEKPVLPEVPPEIEDESDQIPF